MRSWLVPLRVPREFSWFWKMGLLKWLCNIGVGKRCVLDTWPCENDHCPSTTICVIWTIADTNSHHSHVKNRTFAFAWYYSWISCSTSFSPQSRVELKSDIDACLRLPPKRNCLDTRGPIREWDVSSVTDTRDLFEHATAVHADIVREKRHYPRLLTRLIQQVNASSARARVNC